MKATYKIFWLTLLWAHSAGVFAQTNRQSRGVQHWKADKLTITLKDELNHPAFSWPLSLLHYKVDFGPSGIQPSTLTLVEQETGRELPFQLEQPNVKNDRVYSATLAFYTDLPTGGNKTFVLRKSKKNDQAANHKRYFSIVKTAEVYQIKNGFVQFEIPAPGSKKLVAPIVRFGPSGKWIGNGELTAEKNFRTISVKELSSGPVQVAYEIT